MTVQPNEAGVVKRTVYPAGKRIVGKRRGAWLKLNDEEAAVIYRMRESRAGVERPNAQTATNMPATATIHARPSSSFPDGQKDGRGDD